MFLDVLQYHKRITAGSTGRQKVFDTRQRGMTQESDKGKLFGFSLACHRALDRPRHGFWRGLDFLQPVPRLGNHCREHAVPQTRLGPVLAQDSVFPNVHIDQELLLITRLAQLVLVTYSHTGKELD